MVRVLTGDVVIEFAVLYYLVSICAIDQQLDVNDGIRDCS